MLLFLLFVLVCCAVRCDYVSNNYYVIEMPEEKVAKDYDTPFKVYWNVPTQQCKSRNVIFDNLEKFGIIKNDNDTFQGGRITIMYDPGVFPAIFQSDSGNYRYRNGGVPQQGNLEIHLTAFRESVNKSIPDPEFKGIGVIDFESWRPIYRQQFGTLTPYQDLSMNIEKRRHWWWPTAWQKLEATERFEEAARVFMQTTLSIAKQMRPHATWGYYAYPYCFNKASNYASETCSDLVQGENDKVYWLWAESTALYPSVYSSVNLTTSSLAALVRGRVTEANRVKRDGTLVLPYFWFRYRDASFISEVDLKAVLEALKTTNASGLIIWGSSSDVSTLDKCNDLYNYVENTLGPITKTYIQQINSKFYDQEDVDLENEYSLLSTTEEGTKIETTTIQSSLNEIETSTNESSTVQIDINVSIYSQNSTNYEEEQMSASSNNKTDSSLWDLLSNKSNFITTDPESYTEISSSLYETSVSTDNILDSDDFLAADENNAYLDNITSTDSAENYKSSDEDYLMIVANSTASLLNITESSSGSSENYSIIKDEDSNNSETSVINAT